MQVGDSRGQIIESAGWQRPDTDHCDNWWCELRWPASSDGYHQLAARMVTGLRDAFGIADPATLVYEAWNERGGETELPLLGLSTRRAHTATSVAPSSRSSPPVGESWETRTLLISPGSCSRWSGHGGWET
ncbi:TY-Chap domain-containing protein [Nocardia sp. NPDC003726]